MGQCGGVETRASRGSVAADPRVKSQYKVNKDLTKKLNDTKAKARDTKKLVLLGAGSAGKSTIFKQVVHLYGDGFSDRDRSFYYSVILSNVMFSMKKLVAIAKAPKAPAEGDTPADDAPTDDAPEEEAKVFSDELEGFIDEINSFTSDGTLTEALADGLELLWKEELIQKAWDQRAIHHIPDCVAYYMTRLKDIAAPGYVPSLEDIIRSRSPTTAIVQTKFRMRGNEFIIVDVGGQKNERRKWIHCFEDAMAAIFVAAISEYDELLIEDESTNRLIDAIDLFGTICAEKYLSNCIKIVFLNKRDLFMEKIERIPLTKCFPDYKGSTPDEAKEYIVDRFLEKSLKKKDTYMHFTCATDTNQIDKIFNDVMDGIIRISLTQTGLMHA